MSALARPRRVLILAAHPDDEVLGMGGTIALHTKMIGDVVRIVCLTDGSSSQYPGDDARRIQKNEEAVRAATVLGVKEYVHLGFPDMRLDTVAHVELNRAVEDQVKQYQPDIVYTVHPDVNLDHRAVFRSVTVATRPTPGQRVRRVLTYAPTSSTEWTAPGENWFVPNWFTDITKTLDLKLEAFTCFETEQRSYPHPRNTRALRTTAEFYGTCVGCELAEPFVLVRSIEQHSESMESVAHPKAEPG
jgi:LmbE family N-acetylglucosaminyl deacetylase